jgi:hypothetical protein
MGSGHFPEHAAGLGRFDESGFAALGGWVGFVWFRLEIVRSELLHRHFDVIDLPADVVEPLAMLVEML